MATSRFARFAVVVAAIAALLFLAPPVLVQLGAATSAVGFPIHLVGGGIFALLSLLLGAVALWFTRSAAGRSGRGLALCATGVGAAILVAFVVMGSSARGLPPINDITTSPDDPPQFSALLDVPANDGRDMGYPGEAFASQQRAAYPDLAPIALPTPVNATVARTKTAMEGLGWDVVRADAEAGEIEATDTSRVWRFVDDIVVRVRPRPAGSVVDVRSKSREGQSDLGANAARIRQLAEALR